MALHKKGADAAAIPEFEKAIELDPNEPSFRLALGMSLEKVGHISEAADAYRAYLEMDPGSPDARKAEGARRGAVVSSAAVTPSFLRASDR